MARTSLRLVSTIAVIASLVAAMASAQGILPDRRTFFTFSAPVTVPGVTVPAGKYLFRIANPETASRVVQVMSADGRKPYAQFFILPAERPEPATEPEVRFMETAPGTAHPIKTWWYPTQRMGYEFIYPKEQARRLAKLAKEPVLTTAAETTTVAQTDTGVLVRISSTGQETKVVVEAKPTSATPLGDSQQGEVAPPSIVLPRPPDQ